DLGRREEALRAAEESVEIYRYLADSRPDAFFPDLALSLNNLGNRLSDLGRREEALRAAEEAVEIRRQLAESRPDAFLPNLANSLNNLGKKLSDLGRREEALRVAEEAVRSLLPFFEQYPQSFASWMEVMARNYRNYSEQADRQPDQNLLGRVDAIFQQIQSAD
ncbi:MAG: tetratricopeptide repeat protein, partial [Synechococcus sp.]